jgi:hypothetical protein
MIAAGEACPQSGSSARGFASSGTAAVLSPWNPGTPARRLGVLARSDEESGPGCVLPHRAHR